MTVLLAQFLFVYFLGNGEKGVHFALSEDGFQWTALKDGAPWVAPQEAEELMRDPYVTRGPDGTYHMVWTWGWRTPAIGYASSRDLVTWSTQRRIPFFEGVAGVKNVWAPEIYWNAAKKHWMVIWSSTIEGRFPEKTPQAKNGLNHRIYKATTTDFVKFSEPEVFFDPGYSVIDATLLERDGLWQMVFKDEREMPLKKFLLLASGPTVEGPWGEISEPFTESWSEGPSALKVGDDWVVYYDHYRAPQGYRAARSRDLKAWEDASARLRMPSGAKHGSFLRLTDGEAKRLRP